MFLIVTPQGSIFHCSHAFYCWTGYREDEVAEKLLTEVVAASTPDLQSVLAQPMDAAGCAFCEWQVLLKNRQVATVHCKLRMMDGPQPVPFYAVHLSTQSFADQSQGSPAGSPSSISSPGSRSAADTVPYFILDGDVCTRPLLFASPGFTALTGYSFSDSCGLPCQFLCGPFTRHSSSVRLEQALHGCHTERFSITCHRRSGEPFEARLAVTQLGAQVERGTALLVVMFDTPPRASLDAQPPTFSKVQHWRPGFRFPVFGWVGAAALLTCVIIALVAGTTTRTALCREANALTKLQCTVACALSTEAIADYLDFLTAQVAAECSFAIHFFNTSHPPRFEGDYARFAMALVGSNKPLAVAWVSDDGRAIVVVRDTSTVLCSTVFKDTNYTVVNGTATMYHKALCNAVRVAGDERISTDVGGVAILAMIVSVAIGSTEKGVVLAATDAVMLGSILATSAGQAAAVYALYNNQLFAVGRAFADQSMPYLLLVEDTTFNGGYYAVQRLVHTSNIALTIVHVMHVRDDCPEEDMPVVYGCLAGFFACLGLTFTVAVLVTVLQAFTAFNTAMQQMAAFRPTAAEEALEKVPTLLVAEPHRLKEMAAHLVGGMKLLLDTSTTPQWPHKLPRAEELAGTTMATAPLGPTGLASYVVAAQRWFHLELSPSSCAIMSCSLHGLPEDCSSDAVLEIFSDFMRMVTAAVQASNGIVQQCEGPRICARWNGTVFMPNPVFSACQAALEAVGCIQHLRARHPLCWSRPIAVHVGITQGTILMGPAGGTVLASHTMVGSILHVAEDVRRLNNLLGTCILLACDNSAADLPLRFETRVVDWVHHRHSAGQLLDVLEIRRALDGSGDPGWMYSVPWSTVSQLYTNAVACLRNCNVDQAKELLTAFLSEQPDDRPARLLLWAINCGAQGGCHALHPLEACPATRDLFECDMDAEQGSGTSKGKARANTSCDGAGL
eukprot:GGOE01043608.1.p1 GENE.GGOE01043608.1~~GGOE01043608.1.p1  ORF type:complete len:957 (-),score=200.89 GGOE01043608.1:235-3105(-)